MYNIIPFVLRNLKRRKLRNWLTIAGIIVGVFAIVSLISLSEGLKESVDKEFSTLGANKISISSKYISFGGGDIVGGLKDDDIRELSKISELSIVSGSLSAYLETKFANKTLMSSLTSYAVSDYETMLEQNNQVLEKGSFFSGEKAKEVILGYNYSDEKKSKDDLFGRKIELGQKITIKNTDFSVIGFLKKTGDDRKDSEIYISNDNLKDLTESETYDVIYAIVREDKDVEETAEKVEKRLDKSRANKDLSISTPLSANKQRQDTLNIISIVIIGIAFISLLVGGVGILNSMYTSVYERKKEIGILMAIGARRKDVLMIFLLESGIIGLIGGFIGLVSGFFVAYLVKYVASRFDIFISVSRNPLIGVLALGFSFGIGILSGLSPAYNASKQEPVESLRNE